MSDKNKYKLNKLIEMLKKAIEKVYEEKPKLFEFKGEELEGLEQAFTFRVGIYFHELLKAEDISDLYLDMEYTKEKNNSKTGGDGEIVRPDMVLHERHSHNRNLMLIEFKGWWNTSDDSEKLKMFTNPKEKYKYKLGVFVKIGTESSEYDYYRDGDIQSDFEEKNNE